MTKTKGYATYKACASLERFTCDRRKVGAHVCPLRDHRVNIAIMWI